VNSPTELGIYPRRNTPPYQANILISPGWFEIDQGPWLRERGLRRAVFPGGHFDGFLTGFQRNLSLAGSAAQNGWAGIELAATLLRGGRARQRRLAAILAVEADINGGRDVRA
jgi:hypothetical protein